jgi:hypothetical protein
MINDLQIEAINRISEKWINWECFKQSKMGDLYSHPFVENEFSTKGVSFEEIFNWVQGLVFQKKEDYDNNQIANQTYLFTYLHTDPTDDLELKKELFSLRRAFKRSYIPSKEDILESSIEYVNTFNNIHFGVSLEGCCLWTIDTGEIFFDQFENRVKDRYFIMYLIGLHNRVALLNFRDQLDSSFPHIERQFEISNIDLKKVRKLRNKILSFYMKFHFTALTNITHIEKINSVMNQIMSADILIQEIKGKTNELDEYLMSNSDRKINKGISSLTIIGSILAPLSIVTSFFCISFYPYNGGAASNSYQIKSYIFAISTSVILSILLSLWLLRNKK